MQVLLFRKRAFNKRNALFNSWKALTLANLEPGVDLNTWIKCVLLIARKCPVALIGTSVASQQHHGGSYERNKENPAA